MNTLLPLLLASLASVLGQAPGKGMTTVYGRMDSNPLYIGNRIIRNMSDPKWSDPDFRWIAPLDDPKNYYMRNGYGRAYDDFCKVNFDMRDEWRNGCWQTCANNPACLAVNVYIMNAEAINPYAADQGDDNYRCGGQVLCDYWNTLPQTIPPDNDDFTPVIESQIYVKTDVINDPAAYGVFYINYNQP